MRSQVIWIIDNNHWERANIRALLIERGYIVEGFLGILHAVSSLYRGLVEEPAVIVLETKNLGYQPAEINELFRFEAPVILLAGVFDKPQDQLEKYKWAEILCRPFTIGQVADAVESHLKKG